MCPLHARILGACLGALSATTVAWIVWALATPGDFFASGSALALPSLACAVVLGGAAGFLGWARFPKTLVVSALVALCYWMFTPHGWWAHPPPPPTAGAPSR